MMSFESPYVLKLLTPIPLAICILIKRALYFAILIELCRILDSLLSRVISEFHQHFSNKTLDQDGGRERGIVKTERKKEVKEGRK